VFLNGQGIRERDSRGERITDLSFILYFNAHDETVDFTLPSEEYAAQWETVVDTAGAGADSTPVRSGHVISVTRKALVVLRAFIAPAVEPDHSVAASLASITGAKTSDTASRSKGG
jgi:glycogen operon protein